MKATGRRGRDVQRERLYRAERTIPAFHSTDLGTFDGAAAYVRKVTGSAWFRRRYGTVTITVKPRRANASACAGFRHIKLPSWAFGRWIVLHEVTHCVTHADPGHGPLYAREFLKMVKHFLGADAAAALRAGFKAHGVRSTVRTASARRRAAEQGARLAACQSPDQRAANLAKARAALAAKRAAKVAGGAEGA